MTFMRKNPPSVGADRSRVGFAFLPVMIQEGRPSSKYVWLEFVVYSEDLKAMADGGNRWVRHDAMTLSAHKARLRRWAENDKHWEEFGRLQNTPEQDLKSEALNPK